MSTRRTVLKAFGVGTVAVAGLSTGAAARGKAGADLFAPLTSGETVPKVRSRATGTATFVETDVGDLDYTVTLKNIEDVTQIHVHKGERGTTGPISEFLADFADLDGSNGTPQSGTPQDPIVVTGTIPGPSLPGPAQLFLADPGSYYVNVHTVLNTSGEVRGQLRAK